MNMLKQFVSIRISLLLLATLLLSIQVSAQSKEVPYASIAGYSSGTKLAANLLRAQQGLSLVIKDAPKQKHFNLIGYTMIMDNVNGEPVSVTCTGNDFSKEAKQNLDKYLAKGRIVSFENIRARDETGKEWKIPSIFYVVE